MELPQKVRIGPYWYDIELQDESWRTKEGAYGLCEVEKKVITIAELSADAGTYFDTFLHECLHACWDLMKLKEQEEEETTVNALATALTQILADNPDEFISLIEALKRDRNKK